MSDLPEGWAWRELSELVPNPTDDIVDGPFGSNLKASEYSDSGVPILRLQNIARNVFIDKNLRYVTHEKAQELKRHSFRGGDIAVTKLGDPLGKAAVVPESFRQGVIVADIVRVRPDPAYANDRYLTYGINSPLVVNALAEHTKGTTRPRVNLGQIRSLLIPTAPLAEQERIADKLDTVLVRVGACRDRLARVSLLLTRFRQSVLAAATSGRLTGDWRTCRGVEVAADAVAGTPFTAMPMAQLLSVIRTPLKTGPFGTLLSKSDHVERGIEVVGIENIDRGKFRAGSKIRIRPEKAVDLAAYDLLPGDVIISRSGTVGEVCVVPPGLGEVRFSTNIIRVVLNEEVIKADYFVFLFLGCTEVLQQVDDLCKGSTRAFLNQTILNGISYPIPSLEEQTEIVCRVETLLAYADRLEARLAQAQTAVDRLTPSLLAKAFRGELVPQDPADEPAAELLKRLAASRTAPAAKTRRPRQGQPA